MTFTTMTRGHLLVAASELKLCAAAIEAALQDEDKQHTLPGRVSDASDALAAIIASASSADGSFAQALTNGARSTLQRVPPRFECDVMGVPV